MLRPLRCSVLLAASVVAVSYSDEAEASGRSVLTGWVTDAMTGKPVPGAVVVATSNSLQGEQTVEADAGGYFRLPQLPAGEYQLAIFAGGYHRYDRSSIMLRGGVTLRVDSQLVQATVQEVDISVKAPQIDVGSSGTGAHFGDDFIRKVPVVAPGGNGGLTRTFEAVARSAPGANADSRGTSFGGATSAENGYQIDGMSVGSPRFGVLGTGLSAEFMEEITVVDSGYMPEFGRSLGALVSGRTRSGGNEVHGAGWFSMSPGALAGEAPEVFAEGSALSYSGQLAYRGDLGAHIGGPIVKDKLWYYVGVQVAQVAGRSTRKLYATEFSGNWDDPEGEQIPLPDETRDYFNRYTQVQAISKFTFQMGEDDSLVATAIYLPSFDGSSKTLATGAGTHGSDSSTRGITEGHVADLSLHWYAARDNKRWNFDTALNWHIEREYVGPQGKPAIGSGAPELGLIRGIWSPTGTRSYGEFEKLGSAAEEACAPIVEELTEDEIAEGATPRTYQPCPVKGYATGGVGSVSDSRIHRVQLKNTSSVDFKFLGHHTLKAGVDLELIHFANLKATTGGTTLMEREWGSVEDTRRLGILTAPDVVHELASIETVTLSPMWGVFLQDSWNIADAVTLNVGLRYDGQFVWASDRVWANVPLQLSPRIGLVWDPSRKGRAKIFGNYGRYYQGLALEMAEINGSIEGKIIGAYDPAACAELRSGGSPDECINSEDSRWDNDHEGANRKWGTWGASPTTVDPNMKAQALDEWVVGADWEFVPGWSTHLAYRKRMLVRAIEDMSRDEAASYFLGNPGEGIATDFPRATRKYDSVLIELRKAMADNWMLNLSYNLAWLRGNYAGLIKPEIDQLLPHITSDFDLPSLLTNRDGWLPGDHRHHIKLYAAGTVPIGSRVELAFGGAAEARSGAPTNYLGSHHLYGGSESFLLKRGSGLRLPWRFDVNLTAQATFKFTQDVRLSLAAEAFNLFNLSGVTGRDEIYSHHSDVHPLAKNGATEAELEAEVQKIADDNGAPLETYRNPNFGADTSYQDPLTFRLFVRMEF